MTTLTPIQSQVLAGLIAGESVTAVARTNGIHRSTIYEWRQHHPHFSMALEQARARHQSALVDFVQDLAAQALETVSEAMASHDLSVRLRAAQIVLRVSGTAQQSAAIRQNPTQKTRSIRNSNCVCGSGRKYKHCCGTAEPAAVATA